MLHKKIGTLNESSLHESLKHIYAPKNAKLEVEVGTYICDIVCENENIIEIQTSNLSRIRNKIASLLKTRKVKVVFQIIENNYIRTFGKDKTEPLKLIEKSYRKSPKHQNIFSLFREITGFYFLLDHKNLELELVYIDIETIKVDDKKGRSPYKRPRIVDKKLLKINRTQILHSLSALLDSVLSLLPENFSRKDLHALTTKKDASFTLWVLKKCKAIEFCEKKGNLHIYQKIKI